MSRQTKATYLRDPISNEALATALRAEIQAARTRLVMFREKRDRAFHAYGSRSQTAIWRQGVAEESRVYLHALLSVVKEARRTEL